MKVLASAIVTKFTTAPYSDFYNDIDGQLYHTIAPQNVSFPYAVFSFIHDMYEYNFKSDFENVLLQFDLFSNSTSPVEIEDMFTHLKTFLDTAALSVTGYTQVYLRREGSRLFWESDTLAFHRIVEYRVFLRKT